jgi:predicted protein tyrosine phosphatase
MAFSLKEIPDNTVIISINEEEGNFYPLKVSGDKILRVRFSDVTGKVFNGEKTYLPINGDTALAIVNFIDQHKGKDIICHCQAGISRSSAVCLYLHYIHGYNLKERFWQTSQPNPYVLGRLLIVDKYKKDSSQERNENFSIF